MSATDGIGQTPCSFEHYLVVYHLSFDKHNTDRNNGSTCITRNNRNILSLG